MTSVLAGHIILKPTQPVGSGRPQRESNLGPPQEELRALPTELPRDIEKQEEAQQPCTDHTTPQGISKGSEHHELVICF